MKAAVFNARTEVNKARDAYDESRKSSDLQEEVLAGTRRKYELGTETLLDVVITQRDTTTAELVAADAKNRYVHARSDLENSTGAVLSKYDIGISEAKNGIVDRPSDSIPLVK